MEIFLAEIKKTDDIINRLTKECQGCKYKGIYICTNSSKCDGKKDRE